MSYPTASPVPAGQALQKMLDLSCRTRGGGSPVPQPQLIPGAQLHLQLRGKAALKFQQNPAHHPQTSHHKVLFAPTVDNALTKKKGSLVNAPVFYKTDAVLLFPLNKTSKLSLGVNKDGRFGLHKTQKTFCAVWGRDPPGLWVFRQLCHSKDTSRTSPFCQCIVCKLHLCFPKPTRFTHVFEMMPAPQPPASRNSVPGPAS